jgi:deazaflavin-dependent oxidoreductase (nitroreductase family)
MAIIKRWQAAVRRLVGRGWASGVLRRLLPPIDRGILRLTSGRWSLTYLVTGLPVALVSVEDSVRGALHSAPLVVIPDKGDLILVASNFGSKQHPHWCALLRSVRVTHVLWRGTPGDFSVEELEGADRRRAWSRATELYQGYGIYAERAGARGIPVFRLMPREP